MTFNCCYYILVYISACMFVLLTAPAYKLLALLAFVGVK